jgi:Protein of unknown function (DUF1580)
MNDLLCETRLTFSELASSEHVNASTVWRWSLRGCRGVKLESFSIGAKRFTTVEAFGRFVAATTAIAQGGVDSELPSRTNRQREAAITKAERELAEAGI